GRVPTRPDCFVTCRKSAPPDSEENDTGAVKVFLGIMRCKCIKTISAVRTHLIADAKVYKPVPSCSQQEVIVILKDKTQLCLDPAGRQAQDIIRILEAKEM
uniref:Chemokine interleukin-8-like domain-containing protein n=1 Tax=Xiphophorus couchianus TaxID=32473 RepID=A0A3B5LIK4_9TELE